jgi:S1-C subfamily serine protease
MWTTRLGSMMLATLVFWLMPASAQSADDDEKGSIGVMIKLDENSGAISVLGVLTNSPAEKAGIMNNDILLKVGDDKVETLAGFVEMIQNIKPGEKVKITVQRDGNEKVIEVTVGKRSEVLPNDDK